MLLACYFCEVRHCLRVTLAIQVRRGIKFVTVDETIVTFLVVLELSLSWKPDQWKILLQVRLERKTSDSQSVYKLSHSLVSLQTPLKKLCVDYSFCQSSIKVCSHVNQSFILFSATTQIENVWEVLMTGMSESLRCDREKNVRIQQPISCF